VYVTPGVGIGIDFPMMHLLRANFTGTYMHAGQTALTFLAPIR
jgi:hypothetical protein